MKALYILSGIPASGKGYCAKHLLGGCEYVSRDEIRFSKLGKDDKYFDHEKEVARTFYKTIAAKLENGDKDVVADATHITVQSIQKTLKCVEHYLQDSSLDDYRICLIYLDTPLRICKERNSKRTGLAHVPEHVLDEMYSKRYNIGEIKNQISILDDVYVIGEWYE